MAEHTPGRVKIYEDSPDKLMVCTEYCDPICTVEDMADQTSANARRLVAAWNAAHDAGLSTAALEAGAVKAMVEAGAAKDAEIERLRAKLGPEETNPAHEEQARKFRKAMAATEDGKPDGTLEGLATCAKMLNTYAPDCFPANEKGQVHMARAMMESAADEIMAYLATIAKRVEPS